MVEDLWITKERFFELLIEHGSTAEQLDNIALEARKDPEWRKRAQSKFSAMRKSLEDAQIEALIADHLERPPSNEEPS